MGGPDGMQTCALTTYYFKKDIQFLLCSIRGDAQSCGRVNLLLLQCSCIAEIIKHHNEKKLSTKGAKYEMAEDFIKTLLLILEINGGFTKVIHLLLLQAV
jgi:hypothetical protein